MTTQGDVPVQLSFTLRIDTAHRADFLDALTALAETAAKEEGVLGYSVGEDLWEPGAFVFVERYSGERALAEHQATPECQRFVSSLPGWLLDDAVVRMDEVSEKATFSLGPADPLLV